MSEFHNPYHFIPIPETLPGEEAKHWTPAAVFEKGYAGCVTQQRYHSKVDAEERVHSGRIVCSLATETPSFVGAERGKGTETEPAAVEPYRLDGHDAVPASSLRGMLSSLAEAASNSAMRVLEDRDLMSRDSSGRRFLAGTTHQFFADDRRRPYRRSRAISPAEAIFGVVEHEPPTDKHAHSLASRVRVSAARFDPSHDNSKPRMAPVTLKILDCPKPPCPSMYFKPRGAIQGGYVPKLELAPDKHEPNGRKVYLHKFQGEKEPWRTNPTRESVDCLQKARIKPLRAGLCFLFHLDFANLTDLEVGLLLYCVCPHLEFRHKLGMGKPLGLGTVHVQPLGLFLVDRLTRYTALGYCDTRYSEAHLAPENSRNRWPDCYAHEREAPSDGGDILELRDRFRANMDPKIRKAIELLGIPVNVTTPVHTPQVAGSDLEQETFKWFVANDSIHSHHKQFLRPLTAGDKLPTLKR